MTPSRMVPRSAIVITACLSVLSGVLPATAQQYEASLLTLEYAPDPLARSPRLLGMGRLTLADDIHNRINLWDFAGNPAGIATAESVSTFEYRPSTRSSSGVTDLLGSSPVRERQHLRARQTRHAIEAWKRSPGETAYGLVGEVATLQWDRAYTTTLEQRGKFTVPSLGIAVNGRLPWVPSNRFDYAMRLSYTLEIYDDAYLDFWQVPEGDYIGEPTPVAAPRDLFQPNHAEVAGLSFGGALGIRLMRNLHAALGYDHVRAIVRSRSEGQRASSRTDERRPFDIGQASLIGRFGPLEVGADGRAWRSESEETFFWSVSAGPTQGPLVGQGKRLDRKEEGASLRTRGRWVAGPLELGGAFNTTFRRSTISPWFAVNASDPMSFNDFLSQIRFREGTPDTLLLPTPIRFSQVEERGIEVVGGVSLRVPGELGRVGAEVHRWRREYDQEGVGDGPKPVGWEVRAGGEFPIIPSFAARLGWSYGIFDQDDLTSDNRFRHTVVTAGFGHRPSGSRWSLDLGYAFEWVRPDFPDLLRQRENRQHFALQSRWLF